MTQIVFIGDSHMQGLKPRLQRMIPDANLLRIEARPGWSARRYARSGDVPRLTRGADVVVFELGGNDASAGISPIQHGEDVRQLIMQAQPAKVIWVAPGITGRSELEANRAKLKPIQKKLVEAAGGVWIDGHKLTDRQHLRSDLVHYTRAGYDAYAKALVRKLGRLGRGTPQWVLPVGIGVAAVGGLFVARALYLRHVDRGAGV